MLSEEIGKLYCVLLGLGMAGHVKIAVGISTMSACCCKLFLRSMAEYVCVWELAVSVASSCVVDYIRGRRRLGGVVYSPLWQCDGSTHHAWRPF